MKNKYSKIIILSFIFVILLLSIFLSKEYREIKELRESNIKLTDTINNNNNELIEITNNLKVCTEDNESEQSSLEEKDATINELNNKIKLLTNQISELKKN